MLAKRGWHWGNLSAENREEHMLWHTWQGRTYDFFEERRFRDLFYEFGVHPDAAFGWALPVSHSSLDFALHEVLATACGA